MSRSWLTPDRYSRSAVFVVSAFVLSSCVGAPKPESDDTPPRHDAVQEVLTYRSCSFATPGELVPLPRTIPEDSDPIAGAIAELVQGLTQDEADRGCTSFFSAHTQNALRDVRRGESADTVIVEFRDLTTLIPDSMGARSFLPPGIMAELTWTIFSQFDDIRAIRFSMGGDERAFWEWLAGPGTPAQVFSRTDWEQI